MVFLSLALKPDLNRWANIILGVIYTLIILITMPGSWAFYIFLGIVEGVLTALIVWYAWNWPKQETT
jgi:ABC-type Co2+ transport system permease subunit